MQKILLTCQRILSTKNATILILFIAVSAKILLQLLIFSITGDKVGQLVGAQNFLAGNGITVNQLTFDNLITETYTPLIGWPPGYSLAIAPLLWIFNGDYYNAALFFDMLCVFPFFLFLVRLLDFLAIEKWLKNLFILFAGFFLYPGGSSTSTDFPGLICTLAGFYYLLQFMNGVGEKNRLLVWASLSFFLASLFRYNYIPVTFCACILLFMAGYVNRNKAWTRGGWKMALIIGPLLLSILAFQHFYTGAATYINTRATGFYPENLLKTYPLAFSSLMETQAPLSLISKYTGHYNLYGNILFYFSHAISIALFLYGLFYMIRQKKLVLKNKEDYFLYMGMGISISIGGLLVYLSLRNSAYFTSFRWTYVQELRYYIFILVFIQFCIFIFLFNRFGSLSRSWRWVANACIITMTLGSAYSSYFHAKTLRASGTPLHISRAYKNITAPILQLFEAVKNKYPDHEIILASEDYDICNYARLEKIKVINAIPPAGVIQPTSLTKPIKFLVCIAIPPAGGEDPPAYISTHYYSQTQNHYFYILDASSAER